MSSSAGLKAIAVTYRQLSSYLWEGKPELSLWLMFSDNSPFSLQSSAIGASGHLSNCTVSGPQLLLLPWHQNVYTESK